MSTRSSAELRGVELAWARAGGTEGGPRDRRARRATAWQLVRDLLAARGAADAVLSNPCPACGGPHGPLQVCTPQSGPWSASVTYAAGWAIAAIAPGAAGTLGIDAEPADDPVRDVAGWAHERPIAPRLWVRIEAALKADGRGLAVDPWTVEVTARGDEWSARVPGRQDDVVGWDAPRPLGPPGVLLSVAIAPHEASGVGAGSAADRSR